MVCVVGPLEGIEVGIGAFNLADNERFQILPGQGDILSGQAGEVVHHRVTATLSYRF